ncbi:response regulator [Terriglobus roseus]|uniref:Two-component system, OmpR family, catabolic regulation response regulator CreB n=1 Tax=Terriglobus roseus TaxID=392734 RepID=A0A1H4K0H6_9BACT|nr:response regulator [Terriglobus roseus]SEB51913.1 two-component system, OmpR family, catabolic regulation response regulator CreB [Terriglobus roseus]
MDNARKRVFVVDDEPLIASTLAAILEMKGFTASAFTNPFEALACAYLLSPDLLVSDIVMPGLSGTELARDLRGRCPTCKVLLITGQAGSASFLYAMESHREQYPVLAKPLQPKELLHAIRHYGFFLQDWAGPGVH